MPSQRVPTVTADDVERIVRREFAASERDAARMILADFGVEDWQAEAHRVRLAALKLAGGDLVKLRAEITSARNDYRDVLAAAEYPGYMARVRPGAVGPEVERIVEDDAAQWRRWFEGRGEE